MIAVVSSLHMALPDPVSFELKRQIFCPTYTQYTLLEQEQDNHSNSNLEGKIGSTQESLVNSNFEIPLAYVAKESYIVVGIFFCFFF